MFSANVNKDHYKTDDNCKNHSIDILLLLNKLFWKEGILFNGREYLFFLFTDMDKKAGGLLSHPGSHGANSFSRGTTASSLPED